LKAVKILSRADEAVLIQSAKEGCIKSMQRLYESFLPMIESACRKKGIVHKEIIEDLRQEMYFSLKTAVEKFDFSRGFGFSCYFRHYVKDTILKHIRRNSSFLYIGDGAKNKKIQNNFHRLYAQQSSAGLSSEEIYQNISKKLRVSVEEIQDFHAATNLDNFFCADHENEAYASAFVSDEQPENLALDRERNEKIISIFIKAEKEYQSLDMPISSSHLMDVLKRNISLKTCAQISNTNTKQVRRCLEVYVDLVKKNTGSPREIFQM
jgi:RNA polymerase primary sigma factor